MLCTPTLVYLVVSIIGFLAMMSKSQNTVLSIVFIAFWAFVIQAMCNRGSSGLAWLFVFLPTIGGFIMAASTKK